MKNKLWVKVVMLGALLVCMLSVAEATYSDAEVQVCEEEDLDEPWLA